jgi:hypothetical protein
MLTARRTAFLERMAFGQQQTEGESPPRPIDLLTDAASMLGVTGYMVAIVLLVGWAFGH